MSSQIVCVLYSVVSNWAHTLFVLHTLFYRATQIFQLEGSLAAQMGTEFSWDSQLGYLTSSILDSGVGFRAGAVVRLPRLGLPENKLPMICGKLGLRVQRVRAWDRHLADCLGPDADVASRAAGDKRRGGAAAKSGQPRPKASYAEEKISSLWEVSTAKCLGYTEAELVQTLMDGVNALSALEAALARNDMSQFIALVGQLPVEFVGPMIASQQSRTPSVSATARGRSLASTIRDTGDDAPLYSPTHTSLVAKVLTPPIYKKLLTPRARGLARKSGISSPSSSSSSSATSTPSSAEKGRGPFSVAAEQGGDSGGASLEPCSGWGPWAAVRASVDLPSSPVGLYLGEEADCEALGELLKPVLFTLFGFVFSRHVHVTDLQLLEVNIYP